MTGPFRLFPCILLASLAADPVLAHGGQYRAPSVGGGGARDNVPDSAGWQGWWEQNREPFLRRSTAAGNQGPLTPGGATNNPALHPARPFAVTEQDLDDRIVPALLAALERERSRDVQTAAMIALAKIGRDGSATTLEAVLLPRLARDDQEVRETAALALGIAGRTSAIPHLLALLRDDAQGRKLVGGSSVPDRVRAFATYGLALVARSAADEPVRQQAAEAFWQLLRSKEPGPRDLRVAAVLGLGALRDPGEPTGKRLLWQTVDTLLEWLARDLGAGEEFVQAQAPLAIARLLGRGDSATHQRCKRTFAAMLTADSRRGNPLLQSAAIALGAMALPAERCAEDAFASAALQHAYDRGLEAHVRLFAVIGLGRIGGDANRAFLLEAYANGNKLVEKPWLAIALGVLAQEQAMLGAVDGDIARLVRDELRKASHEDLRAPLALAVGLARDSSASPSVRKLLDEHGRNERTAGYLCTSLGLLGDVAAVPDLVAALERSRRQPFVLQSAGLALGQLGDRDVTSRLVRMLGEGDSVATLVGIATAIGRSGDRRAIEPLLALLAKKDLPQLSRAFTIAALGWLGDKDPLPWNRAFAVDANYACTIDTLSNGSTGILDIL